MPLTDWQRQWCLDVMDKINQKPISVPFQREFASDAGTIGISYHLTAVREKLESGTYATMQEWVQDMRLIWLSAQKLFRKGTPLNAMATHLSDWFERRFHTFPRCQMEEWLMKFNATREKLRALVESYEEYGGVIEDVKERVTSSKKRELEDMKPTVVASTPVITPPSSGVVKTSAFIGHDPRVQKPTAHQEIKLFDV
jgi:hypothetical protein